MKEFTEFDKELARHISSNYNWVARNAIGDVYLFANKPFKKPFGWACKDDDTKSALLPYYDVFEAIKWEDDEPTFIRNIYNPQILDESEKEYLKAVLRPFRNRVSRVIKKHRAAMPNEEFIRVELTDDADYFVLPYFEENKMYVGMDSGYPYSLRELGITYD